MLEVQGRNVLIDWHWQRPRAAGATYGFDHEAREREPWMRIAPPSAVAVDAARQDLPSERMHPVSYEQIVHRYDEAVTRRGAESRRYSSRIERPGPSAAAILPAQAIVDDASPAVTSGGVFAQRVEAACR